jgi:hypothetical protein
MFKKIEGGTIENIQGLDCNIPPVGYGVNRLTGELVYIGVNKESHKKSEQKWKRLRLPADYSKKRLIEEQRQETDPDYINSDLQGIRNTHWNYRLCGFWFYCNGVPVYITGTHWFYLNWCSTNIGYMNYRDTDRKFFYAVRYAEEDPCSGGIVYVSRRQGGKTYMAIAWMLDMISTAVNKHGGIQSKADDDAKKVFNKLVNYFVDLPHFFKPIYDQSQGLRPKKELRFFKATIKGKKAEDLLEGDELRSFIDYGPSDSFHYDGDEKMFAYLLDEFGKPQRPNVWETWNVVKPCMNKEGKWFGKAIVTSTIEDLDVTGTGPKKMWDNSNQFEKNKNGETASGLYRIFFGAHESTFFDEFGMPMVEKGIEYYNNQRESMRDDPRGLSSIIRKNPFTVDEAFRIDGEKCLYNSMKLNDRLERLGWMKNYRTRGNLVWKDGVRDGKVIWEPSSNGRFYACWLPKDWEKECNLVAKRGSSFVPLNTNRFVIGVDPFDHNATEDSRRSDAAAYVLKKYSSMEEEYNKSFIVQYLGRPDTAHVFYEDMIKACFYFGCQVLFENNKIGIMHYFNERGYSQFLMWLPGKNNPGLAASQSSHQELAEETEIYIEENIDGVYHPELIKDWLNFNLKDTQKFDAAMAAGYALIADKRILKNNNAEKLVDINSYFRKRKISQ